MKKSLICILIVLQLLFYSALSLFDLSVFATTDEKEESETEYDFSGSGTENDPFCIFNLTEFEAFRDSVNAGNCYFGKYFKLMNDITMNEAEIFMYDEDDYIIGAADNVLPYEWSQIGDDQLLVEIVINDEQSFDDAKEKYGSLYVLDKQKYIKASYDAKYTIYYREVFFSGTFEGSDHRIIGLFFDVENHNNSLFGYCKNAVVKNLGVTNSYCGGLVKKNTAYGDGMAMISNCYNTGKTVNGNGGVVGSNYANDSGKAIISNCYNAGFVNGYEGSEIGGVVGKNSARDSGTAIITDCYNTGTVKGKDDVDLGGVVGENYAGESGTAIVSKCYNSGAILGESVGRIGGIAGTNCAGTGVTDSTVTAILSECYNTGIVSGHSGNGYTANGIDSDYVKIGGIVGLNYCNKTGQGRRTATVTMCYNTGKVSGLATKNADDSGVSGIAGVNKCYTAFMRDSNYVICNDTAEITNCYNMGTVSVNNNAHLGGVVGYNYAYTSFGDVNVLSSITNCYNTGEITGDERVGGIVGYNLASSKSASAKTTLTNCYNTGTVRGSTYVGGVVGNNYAGVSSSLMISCSYNTGIISGRSDYIAGVVGWNNAERYGVVNIQDCYYLKGTAAVGYRNNSIINGRVSTRVLSCTEEQMNEEENYSGFDFETIWTMYGNPEYPYPELIGIQMNFGSGDYDNGTKERPYRIYNLSDLERLRDLVNNGESFYGEYFRLMNDITMNEPNVFNYSSDGRIEGIDEEMNPYSWTPIGYTKSLIFKPFSGVFDGDSHRISGIYVTTTNYDQSGLFGYCNNATIMNLSIENGYICGRDCGGLVGWSYVDNGGTAFIINCCNTCTVYGKGYCGGIAGIVQANKGLSTVLNCYNKGNVYCINKYVGGIAGANRAYSFDKNDFATVTVSSCYNIGTVNGAGDSNCGLVGTNNTSKTNARINVVNCYYLSDSATAGVIYDSVNESITIENVTELTDVQMRESVCFVGFDFEKTWYFSSDGGYAYPMLKCFEKIEIKSIIYLGDVDDDEEVTILDATTIQRWLAGLPTDAFDEDVADLDEDGVITILDATEIQRWLADLSANQNIGLPVRG